MGQQQLLLVILVVIVVGVATVVALRVTDSQLKQSNQTKVRYDIQSIAASARGFYLKPDIMGGGDNSFTSFDFSKTSFPKLKISSNGLKTYNENGTYVITSRSNAQFEIQAYPSSDDKYDNDNPLGSTDGSSIKAVIKEDTVEWQ
mgnify:CR=1 FL=1